MTNHRLIRYLLPNLPVPVEETSEKPIRFKPPKQWKPVSRAAVLARERKQAWLDCVIPIFHRNFLFELRLAGCPAEEKAVRNLFVFSHHPLKKSANVAGWLAGTAIPTRGEMMTLEHVFGVFDFCFYGSEYIAEHASNREWYRTAMARHRPADKRDEEIEAVLAPVRAALKDPEQATLVRMALTFWHRSRGSRTIV